MALRPKAGQAVVGDLEDEAVVHHTVGGLELPVRHDDAVVEEQHPLQEEVGNTGVSVSPASTFFVCAGRSYEVTRAQLEVRRSGDCICSRGGANLDDVIDEGKLEHPVQSDAVVLQDVLTETDGETERWTDGQMDG